MRFIPAIVGCLLLAGCGTLPPPPMNSAGPWRKYRTVIPHFYMEYQVPPVLEGGYGGQAAEVSFNTPKEKEHPGRKSFDGGYTKDIGTFFYGLVGDFRDWDMTVEFSVWKFAKGRPIASQTEFAELIRAQLSEKALLQDGSQVPYWGNVTTKRIGQYDVILLTGADMYHIKKLQLTKKAAQTLSPRHLFLIRLDPEIAIALDIDHATETRLSPKWHADTETMAAAIIEKLKFIPRPDES